MDVFYFNMTYPPKKTIGKSHPFYINLQKPQPLDPTTILLRPQKNPMVFWRGKAALVGLELGCLSQLVQDTHLLRTVVFAVSPKKKTPGENIHEKNSFF